MRIIYIFPLILFFSKFSFAQDKPPANSLLDGGSYLIPQETATILLDFQMNSDYIKSGMIIKKYLHLLYDNKIQQEVSVKSPKIKNLVKLTVNNKQKVKRDHPIKQAKFKLNLLQLNHKRVDQIIASMISYGISLNKPKITCVVSLLDYEKNEQELFRYTTQHISDDQRIVHSRIIKTPKGWLFQAIGKSISIRKKHESLKQRKFLKNWLKSNDYLSLNL